jgi:hypothetical protein
MNENPNFEIKNGILKKYRGNAKEISLPEGITTIGAWAFSGCKSVSHITVPDGVEEICEGAFWSCSSLTEIRCAASLKKIGKAGFGRCENLKDENGFIILRGILFDVCEMKICAEIPEGAKEFTWLQMFGKMPRPCLMLKNEAGVYDRVAIYAAKNAPQPLAVIEKDVYTPNVYDVVPTRQGTLENVVRNIRILDLAEDGSHIRMWFSNGFSADDNRVWYPTWIFDKIKACQ